MLMHTREGTYNNSDTAGKVACSAGVFFERAICLRKRHAQTSRREEEIGRVKGSGEGAGRAGRNKHTRSLVQLWCGVRLELVRSPLSIRCQGKKNGAV